ncbi:zinc finger and BTB domain-containing protein 5 [Grus japonensis]|uniref:Zinc finger and BTB domain-containing protein 5 n=1 Tax=Grus japonensis TaxID=30415 RepID=A0ABC9WCS5_GRUJA
MTKQAVPLQPMEDHFGAGRHALKEAAAHGKPSLGQAPDRSCGPYRGAHAGTVVLAVTAAHGGPTLEQSAPEGLYSLERIHTGTVLQELQAVGRTMSEQFMKDCILQEGPQAETGEEPEEEEVAGMKLYELTTAPIPHCPALLGEEEDVEESGVKFSLGRRESEGRRWF